MADIKFYRCTSEQFEANELVKTSNGYIFFVTDAQKIYVSNGTENPDCYAVGNSIVNVDKKDTNLVFTDANGEEHTFDIGIDEATSNAIAELEKLLDSEGNLNISLDYKSAMPDDYATVNALGGIAKGTTAGELKEKTLSQVLDDLLFPTINPTITNPSVSISWKNYSPTTREVGSVAPTAANFTTSASQGSMVAGAVTDVRAGKAGTITVYAGTKTDITTITTVPFGTTKYHAETTFENGPTPRNSKGKNTTVDSANKAISAYTGGSVVKSSDLTVEGVWPIFYKNMENGVFTKLALQSSTTFTVTLSKENPEKHAFKVHGTITKIEYENPTKAGDWVNVPTTMFTGKDVKGTADKVEVQGVDASYKMYTRNDADFQGALKYRITYTNNTNV